MDNEISLVDILNTTLIIVIIILAKYHLLNK